MPIIAKLITASFYLLPILPWRAECLEVSGIITRWGRKLGLNTKLVIGIRTTPFSGHSWCQLEDEVISDAATVNEQFAVIYEEIDNV